MKQPVLSQRNALFFLSVAIPVSCLAAIIVVFGISFIPGPRERELEEAFERYLESYPRAGDVSDVRLLVGIIYARDLRQYEVADEHLTKSMEILHDEKRRAQSLQWLADVRAALGRPAPEVPKA